MDRILGKIDKGEKGPLIICIAALHGNEQIGLHAFRNVISSIENHQIPLKGKLLGIAGNIPAIEGNHRFIDYDLNRIWTDVHMERIFDSNRHRFAEDKEALEIADLIAEESQGAYTSRIIVDLHATSSDKGNFLVIPNGQYQHSVIQAVHLPVVIGLDNYVEGTLLNYYSHRGYVSFALEGGTIGTEAVFQLHTSGLWEILDAAGCIAHHDHLEEDHYERQLRKVSAMLPDRVEVIHRHKIDPQDGFRMLPGFHNFQPVHKDQQLAVDHEGPIHCPTDGLIFMPLYQPEGDDGFFIVNDLSAGY